MAFGDAAGVVGCWVSVDSAICRAHRHAAGARRDGRAQVELLGAVGGPEQPRERPSPVKDDQRAHHKAKGSA